MATKRKFARNRHIFNFKIRSADGGTKIVPVPAKVIRATQQVDLVLTPEHVLRSMKLRGVGNTQTCTMAICGLNHKWPHPVEGFIDWQYSRAYVVTKVKNGLPIECVCYKHYDDVARLNDSKSGQKKLLDDLQANGPRTISLYPPVSGKTPNNRPSGLKQSQGIRRPRVQTLRGAKLRFAVAQLGGVAA